MNVYDRGRRPDGGGFKELKTRNVRDSEKRENNSRFSIHQVHGLSLGRLCLSDPWT